MACGEGIRASQSACTRTDSNSWVCAGLAGHPRLGPDINGVCMTLLLKFPLRIQERDRLLAMGPRRPAVDSSSGPAPAAPAAAAATQPRSGGYVPPSRRGAAPAAAAAADRDAWKRPEPREERPPPARDERPGGWVIQLNPAGGPTCCRHSTPQSLNGQGQCIVLLSVM